MIQLLRKAYLHPTFQKAVRKRPGLIWDAFRVLVASKLGRKSLVNVEGIRKEFIFRGAGSGIWAIFGGLDYEPEVRWALSRVCQGDLVIDVGANLGAWSLPLAQKVGESGKVLSFEMNPVVAGELQRNTELNEFTQVEVITAGAWDGPGELEIEIDKENMASLVREPQKRGGQRIRVSLTSIDAEVGKLGDCRVSLIKIDAEGAEPQVLIGASRTIEKDRPILVVERNDDAKEVLRNMGYGIYVLQEGALVPASDQECINWICVHGETELR